MDRFQNDESVRVFIGSIGAAGVGLTLTASSTVIFVELDWVPGNVSQAEDRCHRIGQHDNVVVYHLVLEESLDCRIAKTLVSKQEVIDKALDKVTEAAKFEPVIPGEQASTANVRREQITLESIGLKPEEVLAIHEALRLLAGLDSDHAAFQNDIGYNGCDTRIGHSLANRLELSPKQAALGKRIIKKYHRQLGAELYSRVFGESK